MLRHQIFILIWFLTLPFIGFGSEDSSKTFKHEIGLNLFGMNSLYVGYHGSSDFAFNLNRFQGVNYKYHLNNNSKIRASIHYRNSKETFNRYTFLSTTLTAFQNTEEAWGGSIGYQAVLFSHEDIQIYPFVTVIGLENRFWVIPGNPEFSDHSTNSTSLLTHTREFGFQTGLGFSVTPLNRFSINFEFNIEFVEVAFLDATNFDRVYGDVSNYWLQRINPLSHFGVSFKI